MGLYTWLQGACFLCGVILTAKCVIETPNKKNLVTFKRIVALRRSLGSIWAARSHSLVEQKCQVAGRRHKCPDGTHSCDNLAPQNALKYNLPIKEVGSTQKLPGTLGHVSGLPTPSSPPLPPMLVYRLIKQTNISGGGGGSQNTGEFLRHWFYLQNKSRSFRILKIPGTTEMRMVLKFPVWPSTPTMNMILGVCSKALM